jgi:hypothetical protein
VFGETEAFVYTIEFQKRGLPHAHLLVFLAARDQAKLCTDYDKFCSAELPCKVAQPELYDLVVRHMMHGPCGPGVPHPPPCCPNAGGTVPRLCLCCDYMRLPSSAFAPD